MRELYDSLIAEGEAGILRLIAQRTQEGLQLDFKQKGRPANGAFEDNDRKILAKAVSGFANSAGGLIVWGVNAEKVDGVDCAQPPAAPISNIEQFASEAATLVGQLIQPKHDGVYITPVVSVSAAGSGYLLMYVERSERRPHRSEAKGQKQYFKRAGDSFFEMEHYDIEDAFSRTGRPELELYFDITERADPWAGAEHMRSLITVGVLNKSNILARFPYMVVMAGPGMTSASQMDYGHLPGLAPAYSGNEYLYAGGSDDVVHAGQKLALAKLIVQTTKINGNWHLGGRRLNDATVDFTCRYGCEGCGERSEHISLPAYNAGHHY